MRALALSIVFAGLAIYALKDWFRSLCGLVLMMALIEHEAMPKSIMGIQGLNPWNVVLFIIVLVWLVQRRRERSAWNMPLHITIPFLAYVGVLVVGGMRAMMDRAYLEDYSLMSMISERLINTLKWLIPGLLLFDGCRNRRRLTFALICLVGLYFLIAVQVVKRLPLGAILQGGLAFRGESMAASKNIGYVTADMSVALAGASWAMIACLFLCRRIWEKIALLISTAVVVFGLALTGGRAGYATWGVLGVMLCLLRWRKCLLLVPIALILLSLLLPGATDRLWQGFGGIDPSGEATIDDYEATSGRMLIWPHVIDKIKDEPLIGYGRLGMVRTGLKDRLMAELDESFPHPHNMYFECLLDNGILGSIPVMCFFGIVVVRSACLFMDRDNSLYMATGGVCLSFVIAQLVAGISGQHYYPTELTMGMWVSIFLMLRVSIERSRTRRAIAQGRHGLSLVPCS